MVFIVVRVYAQHTTCSTYKMINTQGCVLSLMLSMSLDKS